MNCEDRCALPFSSSSHHASLPTTTPPKKHNLVSGICQHPVLYRLHKTESSPNMFFPVAAYLHLAHQQPCYTFLERNILMKQTLAVLNLMQIKRKIVDLKKKKKKKKKQQQTSYKMILDLTLFCYDDDRPPYLCTSTSSGKGTKC